MSYIKTTEDGTDRIRFLKSVSVLDPKTKMELLKLKIGFTLPYENELSTLDEQLEWLRKEYRVTFEDDEGINFEELDQVATALKSREDSLDKFDKKDFTTIKHYTSLQSAVVFELQAIKNEMLVFLPRLTFDLKTKTFLETNDYLELFNEFSTSIVEEILEKNDLREGLLVRIGLANRVREILSRKRQRRPLPKIDLVVVEGNKQIRKEMTMDEATEFLSSVPRVMTKKQHQEILNSLGGEVETIPEPTPEPPKKKEKEAKPSKQSQTRSANKARDQKKREQEEYLRRVAEAEKARAEEEERKRRAKKTAKK